MRPMDWAGDTGDAWADEWRRTDRTFVPVEAALVAAAVGRIAGVAAPHVLDIGCGAGATSLALAAAHPGTRITGVDLSPRLAATAAARADEAGVADRCRFDPGDAAGWTGDDGFDLLVSRHGVMFFADPVAAFTHLRTCAAPDASLVFSSFRSPALNPWASSLAALAPPAVPPDPYAPSPFAFADPDHVAAILAAAGWRDASAVPLDFTYVAGAGDDPVADAMSFFLRIGPAASLLQQIDGADRDDMIGRLRALLQNHVIAGQVAFPAAAWIWSATA